MARQWRQYEDSAEVRERAASDFLASLRFSRPLQDLRDHPERQPCPQCGKRRQYYCYDCLAVTAPATHPPPLQLPVNVHVVLHPGESRSKATTLPIATVSPQVAIHVYPTVPELPEKTTLVLYPSPDAKEIDELEDAADITDVVFVDSTWHQSRAIAADARVTKYRPVKLSGIVSLFWRFQDKDPYHLATVEAIYHTVRRLIAVRNRAAAAAAAAAPAAIADKAKKATDEDGAKKEEQEVRIMGMQPALDAHYHGEADDLMYYYTNQYIIVQQSYKSGERVFTGKHFDGYVLSNVDWDALLRRCRGNAGDRAEGDASAIMRTAATAEAPKAKADDAAEEQPKRPQPSAE